MKEWLFCILVSSIISAVCGMLVNEKSKSGYMRFVCSLVCVLAVLVPVTSVFKSGKINVEKSEYESSVTDDWIYGMTAEKTRKYLKKVIEDRFGITPLEIAIDIDGDDGYITVKNAAIVLSEEDAEYVDEVGEYINSLFGDFAEITAEGE